MAIRRKGLGLYLPTDVLILAATSAFWGIGGSMANPYQSIFFESIGTPIFYISVLAALSSIAAAIATLVGGYIADVWGRKKLIVTFGLVAAANQLIYMFLDSHWQLLFIPVLIGSLSGMYSPALNAMLNDSMEQKSRPIGFASYTIISSIPSIFSPYIGGLLIESLGAAQGIRTAFFIAGLFGMGAIAIRSMKLVETYPATSRKRPKVGKFIAEIIHKNADALRMSSVTTKKLLLYTMMSSIATGLSTVYISLYLVDVVKISPVNYGILTGVSAAATIFLLIPAVRIIKRAGLKKAAIISALFSPISMLVFVSANGMNDLVAWSVTGGVSGAMLSPTIQSLQGNTTPQDHRGRIMGMFAIIPLLVTVPAQIISGYLYANVSHEATFVFAIPFYILAILILGSIKYYEDGFMPKPNVVKA